MKAPFKPGDVVCVDAGPDPKSNAVFPLFCVRVKCVYRVKETKIVLHSHTGLPSWVASLYGISPSTTSGMLGVWRFRKIDDEVTEDFRQLLTLLPKKLERT